MALHLATGAIERGDCVAALVGAAQINRELVDRVIQVGYVIDEYPATGSGKAIAKPKSWRRTAKASPSTSRPMGT
jgi:hypothetical protein